MATIISGVVAVVQLVIWLKPSSRSGKGARSLALDSPGSENKRSADRRRGIVHDPARPKAGEGGGRAAAGYQLRRPTNFQPTRHSGRSTRVWERLNLVLYGLSAGVFVLTGIGAAYLLSEIVWGLVHSDDGFGFGTLWRNPWFALLLLGVGFLLLYYAYIQDFDRDWMLKNNQFFLISVPGCVFLGGLIFSFQDGRRDADLAFYHFCGGLFGLVVFFVAVLADRVIEEW